MFEIISGNEYCSAAGSYWERYSTRETSCVAALLPRALIHAVATLWRFRDLDLGSRVSDFGCRFQGPHGSWSFYSPNVCWPSQGKMAVGFFERAGAKRQIITTKAELTHPAQSSTSEGHGVGGFSGSGFKVKVSGFRVRF